MARVSPEIKAAALADLHAGEQPAVVAERYRIERNTVKQWKLRYVTENVPAVPAVPAAVPIVKPKLEARQREFGALILDLLRAKLEASRAIAQAASNPQWLAEQPAAELAVLGQWLDASAFALGDRLAGHRPAPSDEADPDETFSPPT